MTPKSSQAQLSPAAGLNVVGLVVAAAGIMIQYVSGVEYPTIPPGPIILVVAAAVVAGGAIASPTDGRGHRSPRGAAPRRVQTGQSRPTGVG